MNYRLLQLDQLFRLGPHHDRIWDGLCSPLSRSGLSTEHLLTLKALLFFCPLFLGGWAHL